MKKLDYTYLLTKEIIERGDKVPRLRLKEKPQVLRGGCLLFKFTPLDNADCLRNGGSFEGRA